MKRAIEEIKKISNKDKSYWLYPANQRLFLDSLAKKYKIANPTNWGIIDRNIIVKEGGRAFYDKYHSVLELLKSSYPEVDWDPNWWKKRTPGFFTQTNAINFLEKIKKEFKIKCPSDWGKVTYKSIRKAGGWPLLAKYNYSLFECLKSIYSEVEWDRNWFINPKYFSSVENQKKFILNLSEKYQIKKESDLVKIDRHTIIRNGGGTMLRRNNTPRAILQHQFPEVEWKAKWVGIRPRGFWESNSNKREFLETIKKEMKVESPSDWGKVTTLDIRRFGGASLIHYHGDSLFETLKAVYPEISWKRRWFPLTRYPRSYWNSDKNCKDFFDQLAEQYNLRTVNEWKRITATLVTSRAGSGLLKRFQNSLITALNVLYPDQDWGFRESTLTNPQYTLQNVLTQRFE